MTLDLTLVPRESTPAYWIANDPVPLPGSTGEGAAWVRARDFGFGRIVVDTPAGLLGNLDRAAALTRAVTPLEIVLTHWCGVMAPVDAANAIARICNRAGGQLSLRILGTGPSHIGADDGSSESHVAFWRRTDDYLVLLQRLWANDRPIHHECRSFSVRGGFVAEKGPFGLCIPIRLSGRSGTAVEVAGRHADVFELAPGTLSEIRLQIARVRAAADRHGRAQRIRFALPVVAAPAPRDETATEPVIRVPDDETRLAALTRALLDAGVGELMVSGVDTPQLLRRFGVRMAGALGGLEPLQADDPRRGGRALSYHRLILNA